MIGLENNLFHRDPLRADFSLSLKLTGSNISPQTQDCAWLQWYKIVMRYTHACQCTPFYLRFDPSLGKYLVRTSSVRKLVWLGFQLTSTVIFITWVWETVLEIRESHDVANYFDLIIIMGFFAFDYPFKYKWFYRMEAIYEFFEELQTSPLLRIASRSSIRQTTPYFMFTMWYVSTYFLYFLTRWGIFYWSLDAYYSAIQTACEVHFGIPPSWEGWRYYNLLLMIAFVIFFQQIVFLICGDLLSVSGILTMYHVARDLDRALQGPTLTDEEVFELIQAQKRLTRKFNEAFGLLVSVYVTYCSPFYSLHFVDMFSTPGTMNLLTTFTYVGVLGVACKLAIDIAILAKRRKRWLSERCHLLDKSQLAFFLDDIAEGKFCIGSFFHVNSHVTGQVASLLITVAVVRLQTR